MIARIRKALLVATLVCVGQGSLADVVCSFHTLSTINGNDRLADHGFRVRDVNGVLRLERRYADGLWYDLGTMRRFNRPGFRVFLHLPSQGPYMGRTRMLTFHQSGIGSLVIHHGSFGGGSQIQKAWLYHGTCEETL